jgi:Peptidase family M23
MAQPTQKLTDAHRAYDTPRPFTNQIDSNRQIPERQVYSANEKFEWKIGSRSVKITGGFNEPNGHSEKGSSLYLDSKNPDPNKPATKSPGRYNIGIDYVVNGDKQVTPWYSGVVIAAKDTGNGYGKQVVVKTNHSYEYNGKRYPIYNAYSHLKSIDKNIADGRLKNIDTDTIIGEMGKSGLSQKHGEHVDFQSYIIVDGVKIQVSPNLIQKNLERQEQQGTFYRTSNNESIAMQRYQAIADILKDAGLQPGSADWNKSIVQTAIGTELDVSEIKDIAKQIPGIEPNEAENLVNGATKDAQVALA